LAHNDTEIQLTERELLPNPVNRLQNQDPAPIPMNPEATSLLMEHGSKLAYIPMLI